VTPVREFVLACRWILFWALWLAPSLASADDEFGFAVVRHELGARMCAGEKSMVTVELRNDGDVPWDASKGDRFAYHWLAADGSVAVREGKRTEIPGEVLPGRTATIRARVDAPTEPGRYTLVWAMVRDKVRWYPDPPAELQHQRAIVDVGEGATPLAFTVVEVGDVDVAAGEESKVRIRLRNDGCASWSHGKGDSLAYHWFDSEGREVVHEGRRTAIPWAEPGATIDLDATIEGPPNAGAHVLVLEPVREPLAWFGVPASGSERRNVDIAAPPLAWSLVSAAMPQRAWAGESLTVRIVARNEGTAAWASELGDRLSYRITPSDPELPAIEGVRTPWPSDVDPGEEVAVAATLELPTAPGRYTVRWRPVRENVRWFGPSVGDPDDTRDAFVIEIGPPQLAWSLVDADVGGRQWAGRTSIVRVHVRNDGGDAWSPSRGDRLSYRWYDDGGVPIGGEGMRSELPHDVAPGETVAVDVRVRAPESIGPAVLEIGMLREHVAWFPNDPGARRRVLVVRWGMLLTTACVVGLAIFGVAARSGAGPFARVVAEAWAPLHAAVACLGLGEMFADLARIEAWTGTATIAASASAWAAVVLLLVPLRWRTHVAVFVIAFAFALALVDLGYLDFFGSIVPVSAVTALHHLGDAHATVFSLWRPEYVQLLWPLVALVTLVGLAPPPRATAKRRVRLVLVAVFVAAALPSIRALVQLADSPIGARVFSERDNVGRLGLWNAHLFEAGRTLGRWLGVDALTPAQRREVAQVYAARHDSRPPPTPTSAPLNLVVIQVEAMQSFAIDAQIEGEPVMPFLASADESATVFTHVFDQTAQGRTSDAEYLVLQSSHPLRTGALAFLRADNEFDTLAHRLAASGYDTLSAHPYARGFWNRAVIHPRYGFAESLFRDEIGDGPVVGWGLSDVEFLARMAALLEQRREPFFAFFITLGLHHPYAEFPPHLAELELGELEGTAIGNYLQGMRHADRALAGFFAALRSSGLAERTVVLVYGDHAAGLPRDANLHAVSGVTRWDPTVPTRAHRVPAFLWRPDATTHGRDDRAVGQIDLAPTVLDALGVAAPPAFLGRSLLHQDTDAIVALPDGSAIASDRMWIARGRDAITGGGCYDRSGRARDRADCDELARRAAQELWAARAVLDHDLHASVLQP
jgi:phosphoglycerol transferase MdoB-like AlkP superfamily enzyme